jgi:hypothetical protein
LGFSQEHILPALGYPSECILVRVLYSDVQKRALLDCFGRFFSEAYRRDAQRKISVKQRDEIEREFYPIDGYDYSLRSLFFELVAACKHSAFSDEREVRFFYTEHNDIQESLGRSVAKKRFRLTNGYLAPYTTTDNIRQAYPSRGLAREKLPLTEVLIGPHPQADLAALSIRQFLDASGYGDVPVNQSAAPYR